MADERKGLKELFRLREVKNGFDVLRMAIVTVQDIKSFFACLHVVQLRRKCSKDYRERFHTALWDAAWEQGYTRFLVGAIIKLLGSIADTVFTTIGLVTGHLWIVVAIFFYGVSWGILFLQARDNWRTFYRLVFAPADEEAMRFHFEMKNARKPHTRL